MLITYLIEIGRQWNYGIVRQAEGLGCGYCRIFGQVVAGSKRLVPVKHQQFFDFVVQCCTVHTRFGAYIQQFQVYFIGLQSIGIPVGQSLGIHCGQFLCILQPGIEQFLLLLQHDDVQTYFFGLQ